jgi:hypothetical protein
MLTLLHSSSIWFVLNILQHWWRTFRRPLRHDCPDRFTVGSSIIRSISPSEGFFSLRPLGGESIELPRLPLCWTLMSRYRVSPVPSLSPIVTSPRLPRMFIHQNSLISSLFSHIIFFVSTGNLDDYTVYSADSWWVIHSHTLFRSLQSSLWWFYRLH